MKQHQKQLFAVFLILLITTQEIYSAKYHPKKLQISEDESNSLVVKNERREKRSIFGVLFGIAFFASLANIGFELYLHIEGCCGLIPEVCEYQREFNISRDIVKETSDIVDGVWLNSENLLVRVQTSNFKNQEIGLELKRITDVFESIVQAVDPNIIEGFNNITDEIRNQVEANNETVLQFSNADVDFQYQSLFDTSRGRIQAIAGLISLGAGSLLNFAWNKYKTAQIAKTIRSDFGHQLANVNNKKAVKVLGASNADQFIKQTANAKRKADLSTSRGAKIFRVAGGIFLAAQIGFEIWSAVAKVQQCQTIRDRVKEAAETIKPEEQNVADLLVEVQDHHLNMSDTYNFIRAEVSNEDFIGYLEQVKELTDSASTQTPELQQASSVINTFISTINTTADGTPFENQQDSLIKALGKVTFTLDCFQKKVKTFQVSAERCESGNHGHLEEIFQQVSQEFDTNAQTCSTEAGVPFTSFADVEQYVAIEAVNNTFSPDCILNDQVKQDLICSLVCAGDTDETIQQVADVDDEYLTKFKDLCPTFCALTPADEATICNLKGVLTLEEVIALLFPPPTYDPAQVTEVYNQCPE